MLNVFQSILQGRCPFPIITKTIILEHMCVLISGSWQEQPSSTTVSTTRPTSSRPTTVSTTQPTRPPTKPQTRPPTTTSTTTTITTTTTTTTRVPPAITTVDASGENRPQQTTHRPPHSNRPWWSEYHTQRPEQQQPQQPQQPQRPCKSGTFKPSADGCHNYYQCKNGRFRKYSCADGSLWNRNANRCDAPKNVNCNEPGE